MAEEYLMDSALLVDPDGQGLNENCKCTICHNVFNQPKACGSCLNHFCSRCIGRWLTSHSRECPLCKHYVEMRPVPLLLSILSKLQFRCVHNENGCQEVQFTSMIGLWLRFVCDSRTQLPVQSHYVSLHEMLCAGTSEGYGIT